MKISYEMKVNNYKVSKYYVKYFTDIKSDEEYYCFFFLYPFFKLIFLLRNGIKIGRIHVYFYIPSVKDVLGWSFYKKIGQGSITTGALFINKSDLIYSIIIPPLVIKFYTGNEIPSLWFYELIKNMWHIKR